MPASYSRSKSLVYQMLIQALITPTGPEVYLWPHSSHNIPHSLDTISERCSVLGQLVQLLQSCVAKEVHRGYGHG